MGSQNIRYICVTFLLLFCVSRADYYSAVSSLTDLWEAEALLVEEFERYMMTEQIKNAQIESFLTQVEMELSDTLEDTINYYGNPLYSLKVFKRLTRDWASYFKFIQDSTNVKGYNQSSVKIMKQHELQSPVWDDLLGAAKGIARLQHVYNLDTKSFANGTLMGIKASADMTASDCFHLGASLVHSGDYKTAAIWLMEARSRLSEELPLNGDHTNRSFPILTDEYILEYLVPTTFTTGNIKLAHWLSKELLEKNPNSAKAKEIWTQTKQQLMQGRYMAFQQITANEYEQEVELVPEELPEPSPKDETESGVELAKEEERESVVVVSNDEKINQNHNYKDPIYESLREKNGRMPSMMELYERTCRGDIQPLPSQLRDLRCRYAHNNVPFCFLAPFKIEELNMDPITAIYHDVIYDSEIKKIIDFAEENVERSRVGINTEQSAVSDIRTSKNTWLWHHEHAFLPPLLQRLRDITGLSLESAEALQVANYGIGGHYGPHYDFSEEENYSYAGNGNRILTALFYINDVKLGGATAFPYMRLTVPPIKGSLVMWHNMHYSLELDYRTKHAACPVILGSKWICNEWFHVVGQEFHRPCSLTQEGYKSIDYKQIENNIKI